MKNSPHQILRRRLRLSIQSAGETSDCQSELRSPKSAAARQNSTQTTVPEFRGLRSARHAAYPCGFFLLFHRDRQNNQRRRSAWGRYSIETRRFQLDTPYRQRHLPHPQQKSLLSLGAGINAGVKESAKQSAVTQECSQQFIVINVDVMKSRRVKKIVTVDKDCHFAAMTELQRNIVFVIKVVHVFMLR